MLSEERARQWKQLIERAMQAATYGAPAGGNWYAEGAGAMTLLLFELFALLGVTEDEAVYLLGPDARDFVHACFMAGWRPLALGMVVPPIEGTEGAIYGLG